MSPITPDHTDIIRRLYRSKNEEAKRPSEPDESRAKIAEVCYKLLRNWKRPPGKSDDGTFDASVLKAWLAKVEKVCAESGHLEVAQTHVGHVLKYALPELPDGLWIDKGAAEVLDGANANHIRSGYRCEWFNSRGAHFGSGGKEELKLAEFFKVRAAAVEAEGFVRLGATLRD